MTTKKTVYPLGATRNPLDLRRIKLAQVQSPVEVPKQYLTDLSNISCFDQKKLGACVGHAHATMHIFQNFKETGKIIKLSPRYLYAMAKKVDGIQNQEGTYPEVVSKISKEKGCATEDTVLNDTKLSHSDYINITETEAIKSDAYPYRSGGYAEVANSIEGLYQAIYQNGAVLGTISVGNYSSPIKKGEDGLHRVIFCGYGYRTLKFKNGKLVGSGNKKGRIFFYNSWSNDWGEEGFGYFDFSSQSLYDLEAQIDIPNELLEQVRALPTMRITRTTYETKQTLGEGVVSLDGKTFSFKTLEKPDLNNKTDVSCINKGTYVCKWKWSTKYNKAKGGMYIFDVLDVSGRTGIMGHPFNYYFETKGCIGLGEKIFDMNGDGVRDITNTVKTIQAIYKFFKGKDFTLIIK